MIAGLVRSAAIAVIVGQCGSAFAQTITPDAGAYLAARAAGKTADFSFGAAYYAEALRADPQNAVILENALTAELSLAKFDAAIALAQDIVSLGENRQIPNIVVAAEAAATGNWDRIFTQLERDFRVGPVVDGLARGWAHLALGETQLAMRSFDEVTETSGLRSFGIYHKALALASIENFAEAAQIFDLTTSSGGLQHNRRSAMAHAQILAQLDRREDALDLIDQVFGNGLDDRLTDLRKRIATGAPVAFDVVNSPVDGISEIFLAVAEALKGDAPDNYILIYARAAQYLAPDDTETLLMTAELLEDLERYDLANAAYSAVPRTDPAFALAELGRAEALRDDGNFEGAREVLRSMTFAFPDMAAVYVSLGDTLRRAGDTAGANDAYSEALARYEPTDQNRWIVHYTRAVTYHQLDQWREAEADFRAALAIRPDQPQILNYLGYSLVERGEKLDEALSMIERAVAAQPQNGAIVDSLGWVHFQLGDYDDAVVHLENAAALEAVDPVINDHLGDAYWAVGRTTEARFQWHRALSFMDETDEGADRIRRKLSVGLNAVLAEEGMAPIDVADGSP
ncbi:MAG: tetratricopeptide repeat protein [Pseudomonadota bacterium]